MQQTSQKLGRENQDSVPEGSNKVNLMKLTCVFTCHLGMTKHHPTVTILPIAQASLELSVTGVLAESQHYAWPGTASLILWCSRKS